MRAFPVIYARDVSAVSGFYKRLGFEVVYQFPHVDATVAELQRSGVTVLREPKDMPSGERVDFVLDPEGNPVSLAQQGT
jgi:predicted enzyme related to lactoylglutathione lyase